jgi:hypothetical protein
MLWNAEDHAAIRHECGVHRGQDPSVIRYVFQYVESASEIEGRACGDHARVHLNEASSAAEAPARLDQARWVQLGADEPLPGTQTANGGQHHSGAAADLEKAGCLREMSDDKRRKQAIARHEPKVLTFHNGQHRKFAGMKARMRVRKLRCEHRNSIGHGHLVAAGTAAPSRRPHIFASLDPVVRGASGAYASGRCHKGAIASAGQVGRKRMLFRVREVKSHGSELAPDRWKMIAANPEIVAMLEIGRCREIGMRNS